MTNFKHPKCYANSTGNCSTTISGEHIFSDSILELFEENKTVKIAGLPRTGPQEFILASRKSLQSNILCVNHNNDLSEYDNEMLNLFLAIKDFDLDFNNPNPSEDHRIFDGDKIEKWMLKVVCGLISSNQILSFPSPNLKLRNSYIEILFGDLKWPDNWGLYFSLPDSSWQKFNSASFQPFIVGDEIKTCEFLVNNMSLGLNLSSNLKLKENCIFRINKIIFKSKNIRKVIEFKWSNPKYNKFIELSRIGTSDLPPQDWKDWMKK